jgi:hypothetical protein
MPSSVPPLGFEVSTQYLLKMYPVIPRYVSRFDGSLEPFPTTRKLPPWLELELRFVNAPLTFAFSCLGWTLLSPFPFIWSGFWGSIH